MFNRGCLGQASGAAGVEDVQRMVRGHGNTVVWRTTWDGLLPDSVIASDIGQCLVSLIHETFDLGP